MKMKRKAFIAALAASPIAAAAQSKITNKLEMSSHDNPFDKITKMKAEGKKVNLILRHKDLRTNRRHIPIHLLDLTDFNIKTMRVTYVADSIEYIDRCGRSRLIKNRWENPHLTHRTYYQVLLS